VGVILYELLTGRLPFTGDSAIDIMLAHVTLPPPPFATINTDGWLTPALERVVQTCLAKDPKQRPAGAAELADLYRKAVTAQVPKRVTEALPTPQAALLPPVPNTDQQLTSPIALPHAAETSTTAAEYAGPMSGKRCSLDKPAKKERRSWDRFPVQVKVFCQKTQGEDELCWSSRVMDISRGGMKLLSPHKFDPTTAIRIGKADRVEETSELIEASVVWAHSTPGEKWTLGCALIQELSEAELLPWIDRNR
jgi:serine/threonine protein kinase